MSGSPPPLPDDPALPVANQLLDPAGAEAVLRRGLSGPLDVDRLRLRYLAYQPGVDIVVQYEASTPNGKIDLGVQADRSGHTVFRYPDDPGLPALSDPAAIRDLAGNDLPPERLAWVPTRRAALRVGDVVVKTYADEHEAVTAFRHMQLVAAVVRTPAALGIDRDNRLVAQRFTPGRPLERTDALAFTDRAVAVIESLQAASIEDLTLADLTLADLTIEDLTIKDLTVMGPGEVLALASGPVALVTFARPAVAARLHRVVDALKARAPATTTLRPAHGDFNVGQLLVEEGGELTLVDVDTLCIAAPAFDLASYATNVMSGRRGDDAEARDFIAAVEAALTHPVADLAWYRAATLLRRVDRAVRRLKKDWPARTDRLVDAIEAAVAEI